MPESILYTAVATSTGDGRNGHVITADGRVDLDLALPPEMRPGTPLLGPLSPAKPPMF